MCVLCTQHQSTAQTLFLWLFSLSSDTSSASTIVLLDALLLRAAGSLPAAPAAQRSPVSPPPSTTRCLSSTCTSRNCFSPSSRRS